MKNEQSTRPETIWALPDLSQPFPEGPGRSPADWEDYRRLVTAVAEIGSAHSWTKTEFAQRLQLAEGTFSQWASKKYQGRYDGVNASVSQWLDSAQDAKALEEAIPQSPSFMRTRFSTDCIEAFTAAQIMPAMVMITADAGNGKTVTAQHYVSTRANAFLVTMSPHAKSYSAMLAEIADQLDVSGVNHAQGNAKAIGRKLARAPGGTLLIVDECQHLSNEAINELRFLLDRQRCGIALVGNLETYSRFSRDWTAGPQFGQLRRRIFKRLRRAQPHNEDVAQFLTAWGVVDAGQRAFLTGVAQKPGALGQINQTLTLAIMHAKGSGRAVSLDDLKKAWRNRDVEA